ncbi:aminotransferase class I/II-fold pyridoxal phosphate-dependent enzyme [Synechococcus sp. UW140]|uniref:aminotransferase class I/II-fold pyridoxal phosphate-dependent enzyme n=1 Tax=Synechococcus sp. UW140 TaxID=368503 RepID=UPI003137A5C5
MAELKPERRRQLRTFISKAAGHLETPSGNSLLDLASNDTLGLGRNPKISRAAIASIEKGGVGAGASRLVSGSRPEHEQLEIALAKWLKRGRVLLFPSGFQANIAAVAALAGRHSQVLADQLIHHSLLVGIKATGAKLQRFKHNNLEDLQQKLEQIRADDVERELLVISESLFSMEGSSPDVKALAMLCTKYNAKLLLDEAHALGIMGVEGKGLGHGIDGITLISGTFGKAFGSGGAFLAADGEVAEKLLQTSGAFRYSTALAPPLAAAALKALDLIGSADGEQMRQQLSANANEWRNTLEQHGWPRPPGNGPILAIKLGGDKKALEMQKQLEQAGLLVIAIRPPTVPEGQAQLRVSLRPNLPKESLKKFMAILGKGGKE